MIKKIFFLLLLFTSAFAEESFLSANKVYFKNDRLKLQDSFTLKYPSFSISATEADVEKLSLKELSQFSSLHLKNHIDFQSDLFGRITADEAFIDNEKSYIEFQSQDHILFNSKLIKVPLQAKAKKASLFFKNNIDIQKFKESQLDSIHLNEEVCLEYDSKYQAYGHTANYTIEKNRNNIFQLLPKENERCLLKYENDLLTASEILFNTELALIQMQKPQGKICYNNTPIEFEATNLIYDDLKQYFSLTKEASIKTPLGKLSSDAIEIFQKRFMNQKVLKKIILRGTNHFEGTQDHDFKIECEGLIDIDHEKKMLTASSFLRENEKKPIIYEDAQMKLFAEEGYLTYSMVDNKTQVQQITMNKNIKIILHSEKGNTGYGIADKITYSPQKKSMILHSFPDNKVLFWQDDHGLKLSANEIEISFNQGEKKPEIKGIGKVRFSFDLSEEQLLHNIFSKYLEMQYE
ncbi:MAG TPA: hypothetical protein P5048_00160 [Chlamydiales bacterium]|nr:hypothetical protein [Chlamydiales bacterium]